MTVVIRLSIVGKTHQRTYRLVAQDKKSKRDGKFLEILGNINPTLEPSRQITIKRDRIAYWQKSGAQVSKTVQHLIKNSKLPPRPKKDRAKKEAQPPQQATVTEPEEKPADVTDTPDQTTESKSQEVKSKSQLVEQGPGDNKPSDPKQNDEPEKLIS